MMNPFPVYPVSSLRDIAADIVGKTVFTDAVMALDSAVDKYVQRAISGKRAGLAIQVRGDYGTGKTHLLLFAQARLRDAWPSGGAMVTVCSAPATEASFPDWYRTAVAPQLDRLDLPGIFARLLAACACSVAGRVQLTADLAAAMRNDPLEVYRLLRDELLSHTAVERELVRAVAEIAPRVPEELRTVLAALAWPHRQEAALRWLAGRTLEPAEHGLLGVARNLDAEAEAVAVIVALAGAVDRGGGAFVFAIDEFEHLMAEDQRTGTQRNATTVKRLLEGLSSMRAIVLVAGHWRAWEQLPDFNARFADQPPIDLVTLTGREIEQLVRIAAPAWRVRLEESALETVAEAGGRNIRKVLALLHQLYGDTAAGTFQIGPAMVQAAAETRKRLAAETGRPDEVIEEVVRAAGGETKRNELLFGKLRFDLVVRHDTELRLVADICHAATTAELARLLEEFSIAFGALRRRHGRARGLLVVTGAIDRAALALLDPLPGVEALAGEGPDWETTLREKVLTAVRGDHGADEMAHEVSLAREDAARARLREERATQGAAAAAAHERVAGIDFGSDERAASVSAMVVNAAAGPPTSVYGPKIDVLDSFSEAMNSQRPSMYNTLISSKMIMTVVIIGTLSVVSIFGLEDLDNNVKYRIDSYDSEITKISMIIRKNEQEADERLSRLRASLSSATLADQQEILKKIDNEEMRNGRWTDQFQSRVDDLRRERFALERILRNSTKFLVFGSAFFGLCVVVLFYRLFERERGAFTRYVRWGHQVLEELILSSTPTAEILRIKNRLIDAPDAAKGFRYAISYAAMALPPEMRDEFAPREVRSADKKEPA